MTTTATHSAQPISVRPLVILAGLVLAGFGAFSLWVVVTEGYFGFVRLAGRDVWALQMLIDLVLALSFAIGWMRADAKRLGIAIWPYVIATIVLGSIGILGYCIRRGFTLRPGT